MQGNHFFNVNFACRYGVAEAIIFQNLHYWCQNNKANEKHYYEGSYWTFNSVSAFNQLFPYMSKDKIYRTLKNLEDKKLIKTGCFNKIAYDRTKWYAITDFGISELKNCVADSIEDTNLQNKFSNHFANSENAICENATFIVGKCEMKSGNLQNSFCKNQSPIPDINTDIKKIKENDFFEKNENQKKEIDIPTVCDFSDTKTEEYKKMCLKIYNKWISSGLPCRDVDNWIMYIYPSFCREISKMNLKENDILKAIDNYVKVLSLNNPYYRKMTFDRFAKKINDFLEGNFFIENFELLTKESIQQKQEEEQNKHKQPYELCPICNHKKMYWNIDKQCYLCEPCKKYYSYQYIDNLRRQKEK